MSKENLYNSDKVANRIKVYAKSKSVSLKILLEDCELGKNTFSHMLHGRSLAFDSLAKIADYLECSVDYLLGRQAESDEINNARKNTRLLYEISDIPVDEIEKALGVSYATFRCWYQGYGDYFNSVSNLMKLAELLNVSLGALLGERQTASYKTTSPAQSKLIEFEALRSEDENIKAAANIDVSAPPKVTKNRHT